MRQPVSFAASRTFWPFLPIASDSCLSSTIDFHHALAVVDDRHALHLGRAERVGDERDRILRPLDDVDLLAAQLADDRLHARALHADARADRIDVALAREHRDLRAVAGLAHGAADHHGAVVDFRHFLLEQLDEQRRIGARQHDLRPLGAAVDALDDARARGRPARSFRRATVPCAAARLRCGRSRG